MTNKINGIDVSECDYINCCSKKAKCIILQDDILSDSQYCESEPNCYFKQLKRLQEENKRLQMLSCANCGEKYLSPDGAELYEKNVQLQEENEGLKKENEELKKPCLVMPKVKQLAIPIEKYEKLHKALEEIRDIAEHWLKNDWSCYHCRSNMDEKLKEIIKLTRF